MAMSDLVNMEVRHNSSFLSFIFLLLTLLALIIALARPVAQQEPTTVKRQGRDLVFLLDVSQSMLAEDLHPNRLERAKLAIRDCIDSLNGDRVALVIFAGGTKVQCPLTLDYAFFSQMLARTTIGQEIKGGTMIGDAIRLTMKDVFDQQLKQFKDIILITDGEDHESFPVQAAEAAGDDGIRLIVLGIGDDQEGQPIPITGPEGQKSHLRFKGELVKTKLVTKSLKQMALATPGGRFLPVATGNINLGEVYHDLIASDQKRDLSEETVENYAEKFQWFLSLALIFLSLSFLSAMPTKKLKNRGKSWEPTSC